MLSRRGFIACVAAQAALAGCTSAGSPGSGARPALSPENDREEIVQLTARFGDAINRFDIAQFKSLWAPQAVWIIDERMNFKFSGSPDDFVGSFKGAMTKGWKSVIHLVDGPVVEVDGDKARSRNYFTEKGIRPNGEGLLMRGLCNDELVRTADGWRFAKRHSDLLYRDRRPMRGQFASVGSFLSAS